MPPIDTKTRSKGRVIRTHTVDRRADLAAIHMAQKALGLSADDASALKLAVVGVASSADMTDAQRRRYLAHLSNLQRRQKEQQQAPQASVGPEQVAHAEPRRALERGQADPHDERWAVARGLWTALHRAGHVHVDTDKALLAYTVRQTKVEHWRFLNTHQMNTVLESLKKWARRVGA